MDHQAPQVGQNEPEPFGERAKQLYRLDLRAYQGGGVAVIAAEGAFRTGGWSAEIVQLPMRIHPPQFELRMTGPKPGDMTTQAITPFHVAAHFPLEDQVEELRIRVGDAERTLKVVQARRAEFAMPGGGGGR